MRSAALSEHVEAVCDGSVLVSDACGRGGDVALDEGPGCTEIDREFFNLTQRF